MMKRRPYSNWLALAVALSAEPISAPVVLQLPFEPRPVDALPLTFRDNEKIRAAEEKRARRARKRLGLKKS